jgi:hypothetical protein
MSATVNGILKAGVAFSGMLVTVGRLAPGSSSRLFAQVVYAAVASDDVLPGSLVCGGGGAAVASVGSVPATVLSGRLKCLGGAFGTGCVPGAKLFVRQGELAGVGPPIRGHFM